MEIRKNLRILFAVAIAVAVIDQITKTVVATNLRLAESVPVIPGLLNLVHYRNTGAAFSILASSGQWKTVFLAATSVVALIIIYIVARQAKGRGRSAALGLIAGGAVGNLIDRLRFGYVVDFLDCYVGRYHWPAFNVADSAITAGVILAFLVFCVRAGDS
ncbi:MAG: signal peptidase II [Deltaproteobacteria bacterium]|nr:signal peptidase II [Deltaproteobacteria bacterium]